MEDEKRNQQNKTLKNILDTLDIEKDKYKIKLKDETINIIKNILENNPEFFDSIEDFLLEIIHDNNIIINMLNYQHLIDNILRIFDSFSKLKYIENLFNIEIFCNLLNFMFNILVEKNKENIECSDYLLDKFINITDNFILFINIIRL